MKLFITESVKEVLSNSSEVAIWADDYLCIIKGYSDAIRYCLVDVNLCECPEPIKFKVPTLMKNIPIGTLVNITNGVIESSFIKIIGTQISSYILTEEDRDLHFATKQYDNRLLSKCNYAFNNLPSYQSLRYYKNKIILYSAYAMMYIDTEDKNDDFIIDKDVIRKNLKEGIAKKYGHNIWVSNSDSCIVVPSYKVSSVNTYLFNNEYEYLGKYDFTEFDVSLLDLLKNPTQSIIQFGDTNATPVVRDSSNFIGSLRDSKFSISCPTKLIQTLYRIFDSFELSNFNNIYRFDNGKLHLFIGANKC